MVKSKPGRPSTNDIRRNEILQKAASCFTSNGYNNTTLDDIGESLGFNKAALYYYFKNKEDLFGHVLNFEMKRLWEKTVRETNAEQGIENKLIKYYELRFDVSIELIRATSLSKNNLITLNNSYLYANRTFRKQQLEYLTNILRDAGTQHTQEEITDFLLLLASVQSSLTMSTLLLNDEETDITKLEELKKTKALTVRYFLNSFLNNSGPSSTKAEL